MNDVDRHQYHRSVDGRTGRAPRRRHLAAIAPGAIVASFVLTGCGGESAPPADASSTSPSSGAVLPGGGLSVAEAIATEADPPLAVTGWLVRTDSGPRLCSGYAPAAAEPCGEPSLALEGDVTGQTGEKVGLLGSVDGDVFVVSSTTRS